MNPTKPTDDRPWASPGEPWSLKRLHRLILTSDAYRRSGRHPEADAVRAKDPDNRLLATYPPRRLSAEELRDAMLAVSGELNLTAGGPGVFPHINPEAALQPRHIMGTVAPAYQPSPTPAERNRRTIYAYRYRGLPDPALEVLNRPGADASCPVRDATTTAPQAFALFNGEPTADRALATAARLEQAAATPRGRIELAFRLAYQRTPTDREIDRCLDHLATLTALHTKAPPTPRQRPTSVRRSMIEEMTGQSFSWDEPLDVYRGRYAEDLKPWDVGPATRALADLCLVLFNSNEFAYLE
jgi:hypothetical protein